MMLRNISFGLPSRQLPFSTLCFRLQEKASKDLERARRQMEREDSIHNGDFKAPTKESFVKKLTLRIKGGTTKSKSHKGIANGTTSFTALAQGTTGKSRSRNGEDPSMYDFRVSEIDDTGRRTLRSVRGTAMRKDAQVLYMTNIDIDGEGAADNRPDNSARPALTNVFPGASVGEKGSTDSGVGNSFDDEDTPGIFNRPSFGNISFLRFKHTDSFQTQVAPSLDDVDGDVLNGGIITNGFEGDEDTLHRLSNGTDGTDALKLDNDTDLPWKAEDVEPLADDEEDNQFTPVITFLEGCGLRLFTGLFLDSEVDMDALMRLTNQDFSDMGLPIGPRRKLMDAIQRRRIVLNEPAQMYDSQL